MITPLDRAARQAELKTVYRAYRRDPAFDRLRTECPGFVPGRGSMDPLAVFVGEAPGETEVYHRAPFRGPAGRVFDRLLAAVGVDRRRVFVTNVVKYRPVVGRDKRNRTPNSREVGASRPYLWREIEAFPDGVPVVAMGATALRALNTDDGWRDHPIPKITSWHGRGWYDAERMYMAMYHPAVATYDEAMWPTLVDDMWAVARGLHLV